MKFVLFYHSLVSDWNHGNAHFLRGILRDLQARGHAVRVFEPRGGWSRSNLVKDQGEGAVAGFRRAFPGLASEEYDPAAIDLDRALDGADVVIVHEWTDPALVRRIGRHRHRCRSYRLLFHDTHHRAVTDAAAIAGSGLADYDGVLAFGAVIRDIYLREGWTPRAWVWHEAADAALFRLMPGVLRSTDLVWVGNWGDGERTQELAEFLLRPVRILRLKARVRGVRYPEAALLALADAGACYGGWIPNHEVPRLFAEARVTVHVPRRPYAEALPGIPTIRMFEALACGIPLVSAPWDDCEGLFRPGRDYLLARSGGEMVSRLRDVLHDPELARSLAESGRATVLARHTCTHRVDELLAICRDLGLDTRPSVPSAPAVQPMGAVA